MELPCGPPDIISRKADHTHTVNNIALSGASCKMSHVAKYGP